MSLKQKNLLHPEQIDVLKNLGTFNEQLLKRQISRIKKTPVSKMYEPELRIFALTLHFYSPRAYMYVRRKFNTSLPHPKTLSKWYKSINGEPGFNKEALESIKNRAEQIDYPLFGALIFDEIAIRQHIEYDGEKYSGYVDLGSEIKCDEGTIAKEALVFLVNCINGSWKIPVGYFLIAGLTAEQKANLLQQALKLLHEYKINIVSVTFDGAPANITMCSILGCNFNTVSFQPYFLHPTTEKYVTVFLDPCHSLKLLRNCLGNHRAIIDDNGNTIQWEFFTKLHNLQETEGLHLGNKLRAQHVNYQTQKMKVKLAAQIFSASIADALEICKSDLQFSEFALSGPTIRFIRMINDIFDILNSRNMKQKGFKQPLHMGNSSIVLNKLEESYVYLSRLRKANGQLLLHSKNKLAALGFMICIKSLIALYNDLVVNQDILQYIPTYKINQDHIELFFGTIRLQGGCNNNPTVRQFKAAYKKIIVHIDTRETTTGNCIPLEAVSILNVSANSSNIINRSTPKSRLFSDSQTENNNYLPCRVPFLLDSVSLSEYSTRVVAYIAGFIVRNLRKTIHCETCIEALTGQETHIECSLINLKNRGRLSLPSHDVIIICNKAERVTRFAVRESNDKPVLHRINKTTIINEILQSIDNSNLFSSLREHVYDQNALHNHNYHLLKVIVCEYVKIRLYYIGRMTPHNNLVNIRHSLNKTVLFKGQ